MALACLVTIRLVLTLPYYGGSVSAATSAGWRMARLFHVRQKIFSISNGASRTECLDREVGREDRLHLVVTCGTSLDVRSHRSSRSSI
ncbi:hypothetical protein BDV96DRAFT_586308 [Lophiotrema nucula]|uniref:Secreted protein n=1 Tax=Lophiotrema nucula TaxID=690887 RepID=A0A6A5YP01_9PLEO|nr:hypothetical protein BDV96DRAFT_586308 [Lophiotrema nucula]